MLHRFLTSLLFLAAGALARSDEILYQYEGDVLPYDPAAGWAQFAICNGPCQETVTNGALALTWQSSDQVNYDYTLADPPDNPPSPPFWAEWRFRSDSPKPSTQTGCDARFNISYVAVQETVYMHGDAAVSFEGGDSISGLELNTFHTFRFETLDGAHYTVSADGQVFINDVCGASGCPDKFHGFQFGGSGGCWGGVPEINSWDYVRWGYLSGNESIASSHPPQGFLDPEAYTDVDRFTITLNEPGYVHIEDIAVTVSNGTAPLVLKTWRKDGFTPRQVEIVLDRPISVGETTTFTFAGLDPSANVVNYRLIEPIPAASAWSAIIAALGLAVAGTIVVRDRQHGARSRPPRRVRDFTF